ncbi:ribosome-inactivating protein charybdin [Phtheirospermum japonicum]|uniref:rRNA N-glycosylase n=1 Tax=Phtheirospermum japonicum TaxID=374723 RepID=A0A830BAR6_9LAMI|nr:ribosome-inactivating protein charybdin [Phtheirospermum japonicum]
MSRRLRFMLLINGVTVENTTDYDEFIRRLRVRLGVRSSHNVPALAVQAEPPPGLCDVIIEVDSQDYSGSVRFRLRVDNLYLLGYQMLGGQWNEFDRPPNAEPLIPGSEPLGFNCNYKSLVKPLPGNQGLTSVIIGLNILFSAIETLATTEDMEARARNLIVVIMMICEGARFRPISEYISSNPQGFVIPEWMRNLVNSWGNLSGALLRADAYPDQPFMLAAKDAIQLPHLQREIRTLADIISIMGILLGICFTHHRKSRSLPAVSLNSQQQQQQQPQCFVGLPLLDVFSVVIDGISGDDPRIFGTITINNGVSKRNVYNLAKDDSEYVGLYIVPNCTSEVITAFGEIWIDVKLFLTYDKELRKGVVDDETGAAGGNETVAWDSDVLNRVGPAKILVNETVTWDAFNLGSPYDQVITTLLASATIGSLSINYAVRRNAVAATVSVVLKETYEDTSEVYGRIYAFYDGWMQSRSILFQRQSGDYASVARGHNIPLLKSVVAVPRNRTSLKINADLTEYDPLSNDDPIVYQTFEFPVPTSLPASSSKESTNTGGEKIIIKIDWSSGF